MLTRIDHIQLAMPHDKEAQADAFYCYVLGLEKVEKPEALRKNGGVWFGSEAIQIHLGVDPDFKPARKAHPAFRVVDIDALATKLLAANFPVKWDNRLPNTRRFYCDDPYGNRIEFMAETN